jgi:UDP-N-acetylenolpyruvoylglucosamine reductase
MDVHTDIPLKNYVTMRLGGPARFMADIHTVDEIARHTRRA